MGAFQPVGGLLVEIVEGRGGEGRGDGIRGGTLIIEHDSENGEVVALTDPVYTPWYSKEERPVAYDVTHESLLTSRELDS